jgi:acyl carrier protein
MLPAGDALLALVGQLAADLRASGTRAPRITLDSRLERDLGFDSLSRVELLTRIERSFGVSLSEQVFTNAETPRDLLRLLSSAAVRHPKVTTSGRAPLLQEAMAAPDDAGTLIEVLDWHAQHHGERPHVYLVGDDGEEETINHRQLLKGAQAVAAGLQGNGLEAS